jgi:DNA-binding XRE family transcriptional regulator
MAAPQACRRAIFAQVQQCRGRLFSAAIVCRIVPAERLSFLDLIAARVPNILFAEKRQLECVKGGRDLLPQAGFALLLLRYLAALAALTFITYSLWWSALSTRANLRMDVAKRVGLNLQRLRRDKGLSQEELADCASVHQTYLSGVEGGKRNPSIGVLARIAAALGVDIEELFLTRRSR